MEKSNMDKILQNCDAQCSLLECYNNLTNREWSEYNTVIQEYNTNLANKLLEEDKRDKLMQLIEQSLKKRNSLLNLDEKPDLEIINLQTEISTLRKDRASDSYKCFKSVDEIISCYQKLDDDFNESSISEKREYNVDAKDAVDTKTKMIKNELESIKNLPRLKNDCFDISNLQQSYDYANHHKIVQNLKSDIAQKIAMSQKAEKNIKFLNN